jgi:hypothetical protein
MSSADPAAGVQEDEIPPPLTPEQLLSSAPATPEHQWRPRFRARESFDAIEEFLYLVEPIPVRTPAQPTHALQVASTPRLEEVKYGPILAAVGLKPEGPRLPKRLAQSSGVETKVPNHVLQAHVQADYQQPLLQNLQAASANKLRALPPKISDTIMQMALVSPSCWLNIDAVISEVYENWWQVWEQSSHLARNPAGTPLRLVIYIGDGCFGVPWLTAEAAVILLSQGRPTLNFKIEAVIVYDGFEPSQVMQGQLSKHGEGPFTGVRVIHRPKLELFAHDVAFGDRALLEGCKWLGLMPLKVFKHLEGLPNDQTTFHRDEYFHMWQWYRGLRKLEEITGRGNGVAVTGTAATFSRADRVFLTAYFGAETNTNASDLGRADRSCTWWVSPSGLPQMLRLQKEAHPGLLSPSAPLSDGFVWMPSAMGSEEGEWCPPYVTPLYPTKLMQMSSGQDNTVGTKLYCNSFRVQHPVTMETKYGGVEFVMRQLGLTGTLIANMQVKFPCLGAFDRRDGKTTRCSPFHSTTCGQFMLCHNCRCIVEGLTEGWELGSAVEVVSKALDMAVVHWTIEKYPSRFSTFSCPVHECDDQCRVGLKPDWSAMPEA